jgi:hypothetical protein
MGDYDDTEVNYSAPTLSAVIALMGALRNRKTIETRARSLARINKQIDDATIKLTALTAKAEQDEAALAERAAALDAREAGIAQREDEFASSVETARDELRSYHDQLTRAERQLIHRVMATAGITGNWNPNLQSPPSWEQLRKMVANLPADLPAASPVEVISENARQDWAGHTFVPGSTLTRSTIREAQRE